MIGSNLLITGGTGTLGHAIVRTALAEAWRCQITIFSRSEYRQALMRAQYPALRYVLGDVRDYASVAAAVAGHDTVIHAAAVKRIPEAEAQPSECIAVNVNGTQNVVRACQASGVARCVFISTDKACRASTVYGTSKLIAEGLIRAQAATPTTFTACRYGNVLGSNGSVLQLWAQQAARGEPLTITDKSCTRFWMSERDAVRAIECAATLEAGQIYVPKMSALNIVVMADMLYPGHPVTFTGLRSLEKLHEDLIHEDERACDYDGRYVLSHDGSTGIAYSSLIAPRLTRDALMAMVAE
jgi:UDP-N-acetylglucosamine 4,6-dehydratase/5-epimerase